jgi:hypothetical protein
MLDTPLTVPPLSPDEQKAREAGGILSLALKKAQGEPFNTLVQQLESVLKHKDVKATADSSDEDYKTGILGKELYGHLANWKRSKFKDGKYANSTTSDEDSLYGSGILGRALMAEGRPFLNGRMGTPDFRKILITPGEDGQRTIVRKELPPKESKNAFDMSSDTEQDEAEKRDLQRIESLSIGDKSYMLVYLCKKGEWAQVRQFLASNDKPDFYVSDTVSYN